MYQVPDYRLPTNDLEAISYEQRPAWDKDSRSMARELIKLRAELSTALERIDVLDFRNTELEEQDSAQRVQVEKAAAVMRVAHLLSLSASTHTALDGVCERFYRAFVDYEAAYGCLVRLDGEAESSG